MTYEFCSTSYPHSPLLVFHQCRPNVSARSSKLTGSIQFSAAGRRDYVAREKGIMLWHMYIIEGGEIVKLSSEPYDAESLVAALERLGEDLDQTLVVLKPASD